MAVNMGNGAAVSGRGAAFAHGTACLCDLMLIFLKVFFPFFYFFVGKERRGHVPHRGPFQGLRRRELA